MKNWTKPILELVNMNAEIGGYQADLPQGPSEPRPDGSPVATLVEPDANTTERVLTNVVLERGPST
jgi:hypothetical protein